jgi:hypothetical protein
MVLILEVLYYKDVLNSVWSGSAVEGGTVPRAGGDPALDCTCEVSKKRSEVCSRWTSSPEFGAVELG